MIFSRINALAAIVVLLISACAIWSLAHTGPRAPAARHSSAYNSAARKIDFLASNARRQPPQPTTTILTADEVNAYLAEGGVELPAGVEQVRFSSVPAVVNAAARIDFDKLTAGRPMNPFMAALFSGVHDVAVEAQVAGSNGMGSVRTQSVTIDGVKVPRTALQFLVDHYLKPKYGTAVGLDTTFRLPARIETAVVGNNQVSLTQR